MFEGLDQDSIEYINELTEWLPAGEKIKAQKEIVASIRKVQEIQAKKEAKLWQMGEVWDENIDSMVSRVSDFAEYIRDNLQISEDVEDQEILDAFSEDFPQYQDALRNYLNNGDDSIFSLLEEDEWAVQQQADQLEML